MLNAMPYRSFTIGGIFGAATALLARAPTRKSNRDSATGSRDQRGLLLFGVRSRSGNESCACMGAPEEYTGSRSTPGHCRADCRARYLRKTSRKRETTGGSSTNRSLLEMLGGVLMDWPITLRGLVGFSLGLSRPVNAKKPILQSTSGHSVRHPLTSGLAIP